ncbi:hypothetical protein ACPPVU_01160 [Mucilaginibacter sp. McL0603]|uniref:hypothetical protein n=1 Tax=Mucilaginibacter sp. McL0603 TaxID=3415670 RepID=UPI003CF54EF4
MKYKIRISKWQLAGLIILLFFITLLIYNRGNNPNYEFKSGKKAPDEYWSLFRTDIKPKLSVIQSLTLKYQNPIVEFSYNHGENFVEVLKLDLKGNYSLDSLVTLSNLKKLNTNGLTYYPVGPLFGVFYKTGKNTVSHIDLNLSGESTKTLIRNKSLVYFYSRFDEFSINYNYSDITVVYSNSNKAAESALDNGSLPIDIMFLKKGKDVFIVLMSVTNAKYQLTSNQLYDLIDVEK